MPKMTLLEMVQSILSDMDSDTVDSIGDTVESGQVAQIVKDTYYTVISHLEVPEHNGLLQVTGLANSAKPNYLKLPDSVAYIKWLKYDKRTTTDTDKNYVTVPFVPVEDFLDRVLQRKESDSNVVPITDFSSASLLIINDKHPEFYTSFDDEYLVFDSFDSSVDSTLQQSKTMCYGKVEPSWTHTDTFVPDLDAQFFPYLLSEAKAASFVNLKQVSNAKEEGRARRQLTRWQHNKHRTTNKNKTDWQPNYGRNR